MTTYMVCDGDGNACTDGLQEHEAQRAAQSIANRRGESVWLSESGSEDLGDEFEPNIVIVNDGQYRWGVERPRLYAGLRALGWAQSDHRWAEPEPVDGDDATAAYTALCQHVQPAPGYDPDDAADAWERLPEFVFRPDLGQRVWMLAD